MPTRMAWIFAVTASGAAILFSLLDIPLGAMIGPMLAIAWLSYSTGKAIAPGPRAHDAAILLIGLALGSQVTPDLLSQLALWPLSLTVLVLTMVLILWLGGRLNRRLTSLDSISAHMAAAPGNLSSALMVTEQTGGALAQVAVFQSLRLAFLTLAVPFLFILPEPSHAVQPFTQTDFLVWMGLISVGWALTLVLKAWQVTTPGLIAGVGVAGTVSVLGVAPIETPALFVAFAMMLFGWRIGLDTIRQGLTVLIKTLPMAALSTCFAVGCALIGAWIIHRLLGFPFLDTALAFMPGAFQVMPVIALEAGADALYVTTHHLVRVLSMGMIIPCSVGLWRQH